MNYIESGKKEFQKFFVNLKHKDKYKIKEHVLKKYNQKHRFYHNIYHIYETIGYLLSIQMCNEISLAAAIFHDIIYVPGSKENQLKSSRYMDNILRNCKWGNSTIQEVAYLIESTANHSIDTSLNKADIFPLLEGDINKMIFNEQKLFKEFQLYDYKDYVEGQVSYLTNRLPDFPNKQVLIEHIKNKKRNIGLFAGTFNPFHKGHLDILQQAEKIFDKVIILYGNNPQKTKRLIKVPKELTYRQVECHNGLLTDFIDSLGYDVTLIRGIRNYTDLQYELNQLKYLRDMKKDIKIISFFCQTKYQHISSSSLRMLEKYSSHKKYIVK